MSFEDRSNVWHNSLGLQTPLGSLWSTVATGLFLFLVSSSCQSAPTVQELSSRESQERYFENKIRPLLANHCFECHGDGEQNAELRVDSLAGLVSGGESGPAIILGDASASLLVEAIRYRSLEMPPDAPLAEADIELLERWIDLGAPWPGQDGSESIPTRNEESISTEDRQWWAFQPLGSHLEDITLPPEKNPIDQLVERRLGELGIRPNGQADTRTLIRRVFFDLIGLPPTPEEFRTWEERLNSTASAANEDSHSTTESSEGRSINLEAYEQLIDDLLSRPQYGERLGRHWLDIVRFGQTNGYERDDEKPFAWRYRDYVIQSFNDDKPYDEFVLEQIAGDELPNATSQSRIATGFFRLGVWDDEPDDGRQAEFDGYDDMVVTTSAAFLGLTIGCARCHDHKFDPILQEDYYSFLSFVRNIRPYAQPEYNLNSANYLPVGAEPGFSESLARLHGDRSSLQRQIESEENERSKQQLTEQLNALTLDESDWALGVREHGTGVAPTHVLLRGNPATPGAEVSPRFLQVLGGQSPAVDPIDQSLFPSSGRRLALANWIVSDDNPLTARVIANRIWHHHFGRGLVRTTMDFGRAGVPPTHPALLDWLAIKLIDSDWSIKSLHKTIMLSAAYRRASNEPNELGEAIDPGNNWLWRFDVRRLEAEAIRDTMLAVTGQLNLEAGGRGFFPKLGADVLAGASRPGRGWERSDRESRNRRSVYTFIKRTMMPPMLEAFDYVNNAQPLGERATTTISPQALLLLNNSFVLEQAEAFAIRVRNEAGQDRREQINFAFQLALQREPTDRELQIAEAFLAEQETSWQLLESRLLFTPQVPVSLHGDFLNRLAANDLLAGPNHNWQYVKGRWYGEYEGIKNLDLERGPTAIWTESSFGPGRLSGTFNIQSGGRFASAFVGVSVADETIRGYEVKFSPDQDRVELIRHGDEVEEIANAEFGFSTGEPFHVLIVYDDQGIQITTEPISHSESVDSSVADEPSKGSSLEYMIPDSHSIQGNVAIRSWGAGVVVDDLAFEEEGERWEIGRRTNLSETPSSLPERETRRSVEFEYASHNALTSLCALILNLNELIYID